ncbi:hypothetical protein [Rhodococcus qingshengii]|uniref:hypothetical protein n=1 Tax=Rhodococcus qingshengii TaxID=334542 RepID=UPI001C5D9C70|nr:hypothetical protein [Rhodococcus qingshengii]MBW4813145.1 hypothetical protein [Rhodococcus qingshengii]
MSNEIATYNGPSTVETIDPSDRALERIEKQARAMVAAHQLGKALAATAMVPETYQQYPDGKKENPAAADNATAAILYGAELGFSAVQSLQNIFIVRGKPAIYSRAMVAQVIAAGHRTWEVEATPESVTWKGRRADTGDEVTSTWTIERAKAAGFLTNKLYASLPIEMLRAKCQAEVARTGFPDVLLGMSHSVEDLNLQQPVQVKSERVAAPKGGTAGLAAALGVSEDPVEPNDTPASEAEIARLVAGLAEGGITDPEEAIAFLRGRTRPEVQKSKDLTSAEVAAVLDFMTNGEPAQ